MSDIALTLSAIILAILILWIVPKIQVRSLGLTGLERFKIENEARKVIAEIIGGSVVLIGLFFTWQTVKSTGDNLKVSQEGQITERFIKAIEQLGKTDAGKDSNLVIHLGGIWSLERIARDSEKDYWPIMEILTTYVRQHAAWKEEREINEPLPPERDIQAILTVLGRRIRSYRNGEDHQLDLTGTDLRRAILNNANFNGIDLSGARLYKARMQGIHLQEADLTGANLTEAMLDQAHLEGADFTGVTLDKATLTGANLKGAKGLTTEQIQSAITDDKTQLP
jgi:hypothetical protein